MLNEFGMDFDTLYQWSLDNPENQRAVSVEPFGTEPEKKDIYIMTTENFTGVLLLLYKKKVHELSDKLGERYGTVSYKYQSMRGIIK